ncbi:Maf family protein [Chromatocurvus halotolerans]|uniref:dTTP/UTP pyrophosphatase n=1 Tax=Chromatocurvus halotolerans TaxID=1132028 RepID=A0A4R2KTX0_9GAMM|nr:Maf family protein [Chromatocurvus halotolerans]TCO76237.1 septum formation protein [Chromatocurvus halotolerans]
MLLNRPSLILASRSPRRRELLAQLGVEVSVVPADIDETPAPGETPRDYVERIAREKAAAVQPAADACVLAADTAVVVDGDILGKPESLDAGRRMLRRLSGRVHQVFTAVALRSPRDLRVICRETRVAFRALEDAECERYLASDEPWDKAGAYAIQGLGGAFVERIDGSYSNVVGLPLCETLALLRGAGIPSALDDPAGGA